MGKYWDDYTLNQKLCELGILSCRKRGIKEDVEKELKLSQKNIPLYEKLTSGTINNVIEIGNLADEITNDNSEDTANMSDIDKIYDFVSKEEEKYYDLAYKEMQRNNPTGILAMSSKVASFQKMRCFIEEKIFNNE